MNVSHSADFQFDQTSSADIRSFRKMIYEFYNRNARNHLPWRTDFNSYHIFISEVMLQQTQVDRVIHKYIEFTSRFPDFMSLANSNLQDVLLVWKGLGYNRRAAALRNAAKLVVDNFKGVLPHTPELLQTLPGIGPATAASITAFAFNKPVVFLETNIRTTLIYHFFRNAAPVHDSVLLPIVEEVLDNKKPRIWYSALMDYGTMLKKTVGNETRKSSSYKKQSAFKGSRRELRGNILKELLEHSSLSSKKICATLGYDPQLIDNVLQQLVNENMIRCEKGVYKIGE